MTDISASPGRQAPANQLRPKEPPPMVIQGDFRKVPISIILILFKYLLKVYLFFLLIILYVREQDYSYFLSFLKYNQISKFYRKNYTILLFPRLFPRYPNGND